MATIVKSAIILDNNKTHYERGEQVSGALILTNEGNVSLADIQIGLVCKSEVKWMEDYNGIVDYKEVAHLQNRNFEDSKQYLDLKYNSHNDKTFAKRQLIDGKHEIIFRFQLPDGDIPSSFEGDHGSITYYVEAVIDKNFTIISKIFISSPLHEKLKVSVGGSTEKELGILNLSSGKIAFHACVNRKGFIAGERIDLTYYVWNESTLDVATRATLYKLEIYMCGERHKAVKHAVTEPTNGLEIPKRTNYTDSLIISIPKDVSLSIKSTLISVKYFIHVTLDIPHAIDLHLNIPIIITNQNALNEN